MLCLKDKLHKELKQVWSFAEDDWFYEYRWNDDRIPYHTCIRKDRIYLIPRHKCDKKQHNTDSEYKRYMMLIRNLEEFEWRKIQWEINSRELRKRNNSIGSINIKRKNRNHSIT